MPVSFPITSMPQNFVCGVTWGADAKFYIGFVPKPISFSQCPFKYCVGRGAQGGGEQRALHR